MAPGGLYIVEDIETNYWSKTSSIYGNKLASERSVMGRFEAIVDAVNSEFVSGVDHTDVESISFHKNVIVLRKHGDHHRPGRPHRLLGKLRGPRLPTSTTIHLTHTPSPFHP